MSSKRLPAALGIGAVSYYKALKGECSYNLFYRHIAPAELEREERIRRGLQTEDDAVLTVKEWTKLGIKNLVLCYAPNLAELAKEDLPKRRIAAPKASTPDPEERYSLVEDLTVPLLLTAVRVCAFLQPNHGTDPIITLQRAIDSFPFPAGFQRGSGTSIVLGCNEHLCDLLNAKREDIKGHSVRNLIEIAARAIPHHLLGELSAIERKIGMRVAAGLEMEPICFQFHMDNRQRSVRQNKYYRVTCVVFGLKDIGNFAPVDTMFIYHVKEVETHS